MFSFGDSVAETGNICVVSSSSSNSTELEALTCTHPPYGTTNFGRPSCRWSDGRVVVDFIGRLTSSFSRNAYIHKLRMYILWLYRYS
jgi:Ni,Fe-hydrogenase III small subunit